MNEQESRRIDNPGDFATVAVYERTEPTGKIYRIVFKNLENKVVSEEGLKGCLVTLFAFSMVILVLFIGFSIMGFLIESGANGFISIGAGIGFVVWMFKKYADPQVIDRTIEFDTRSGTLRVLRKGRVEIERPYKQLSNLTVEDHPDAELSRVNRQEQGKKSPSENEKQHCLIGWFGVGGAEQVILLYRVEWPSRNSLFEVQQAIMWTIQKITESVGTDDPFGSGPDTMKPPLD